MAEASSLVERLCAGSPGLTVWGGGYVGLSTAMHFAEHNVSTHIVDINKDRVDAINGAKVVLPQFEEWVGLELQPFITSKMLTATTTLIPSEANGGVHIVAVPTEENGRPSDSAVFLVVDQIAQIKGELCIIESTLTPGTAEKLVTKYPQLRVAIAPRRDWFLGPGLTLRSLPRIVGASSEDVLDDACAVLGIVSDHLYRASSMSVAELTKTVENGIHHLMASYASQLARAFPNIDVNEVFRMAASHWRIGTTYFASAGTGGYCVPMAPRYLIEGAADPTALSISASALEFEEDQRKFMGTLLSKHSADSVAFLGMSYRGDVPILTLSPFVDIAKRVHQNGKTVYVHDPYFHAGTAELVEFMPLRFPDDLDVASLIFVGASHDIYKSCTTSVLLKFLRPGQVIMDNEGTWADRAKDFRRHRLTYFRIGDRGWCLE